MHSLKYQRSTTLGFKNIGMRKSDSLILFDIPQNSYYARYITVHGQP